MRTRLYTCIWGLSLLLALGSLGAQAAQGFSTCLSIAAALTESTAIERNPNVTTYPEELRSTGILLSGHYQKITPVDNQVSVYLIFEDGSIAYSARVPDETVDLTGPNKRFVATHRAIEVIARKNKKLKNLKVVAAGEWEMRNGRVMELNNRSGTYRGRKEHLDLAERVLSARSLAVEKATRRKDFSHPSKVDHHLNAIEEAKIQVLNREDVDYKRIASFYRQAFLRFPNPELPGAPDRDAIFDLLFERESLLYADPSAAPQPSDLKPINEGIQFMSWLDEGIPFAYNKAKEAHFAIEQMIEVIESLIGK